MSTLEAVKSMLIGFISTVPAGSLTAELIEQKVRMLGSSGIAGEPLGGDDQEKLIKYLQARYDFTMELGAVVQEDFKPWLDEAKIEIEQYYWGRYREFLQQKGFGFKVVPTLDRITDKILGLLENPKKQGQWGRKGLVVGHVQSGKTANYNGLICKAADAGYRLIVVVAGMQNNLRSQTQARVDEGFAGIDSAFLSHADPQRKIVGVGKIEDRRDKRPISLTNVLRDFKKTIAEQATIGLATVNVPMVLVVKKNASTLRNVIDWLKTHNTSSGQKIEEFPMLLIDDEADNASINTSGDPERATKINSLLRELLALFRKRCYVGYTATPFANIFIDPNSEQEMLEGDLFPRDFIVSLDPPSNYVGAERIFGKNSDLQVVRIIDDHLDVLPTSHKKDDAVEILPASLYKAVLIFILARAIRILRGQQKEHNSMLVNISRFTNVHSKIVILIHSYLEDVKGRIRFNYKKSTKEALADETMRSLHSVWEEEFVDTGADWPQIQDCLNESVAPIRVVEVNIRSTESLDYSAYADTGLNVIAVGGFSLSRGLTLEGLTVSYFLRSSLMYDTLMQMGRWFGYRPDYADLCRVYMTSSAKSWYAHISDVTEELREEFREMDMANMTPKDFGLKVRCHPESLIVTARNKMRTGEVVRRQIALANKLIETAKIHRSADRLNKNRKAIFKLIDQCGSGWITSGGSGDAVWVGQANYLWTGVDASIVADFLKQFDNHPASLPTQQEPVLAYIQSRADDELKEWDVVLVGSAAAEESYRLAIGNIDLGLQVRSASIDKYMNIDCFEIGERRRVASMGIEKVGLSQAQISVIEAKTKNVPDLKYREVRKKPLLMLHLLTLKQQGQDKILCRNAPAYGISFPGTAKMGEETVEYIVNPIWWQEHYGAEADEEDGYEQSMGDD